MKALDSEDLLQVANPNLDVLLSFPVLLTLSADTLGVV
jgi:hypothetical protein